MKIRLKILIIVWLLFFGTHVRAQLPYLSFNRIGNKEGFNQNTISSILQDHQGFLWFGTPNGLIRYDGIHFKTYKHIIGDSTSIKQNQITTLFEDPSGYLLVGTHQGLNRYDPETEKFSYIPLSDNDQSIFERNYITCIYLDHKNILWIGTMDGIIQFDYRALQNANEFTNAGPPVPLVKKATGQDFRGTMINYITVDYHQNILLATSQGLYYWNYEDEQDFLPLQSTPDQEGNLLSNNVLSLLFLDEERILAGTDMGLELLSVTPVNQPDAKYFVNTSDILGEFSGPVTYLLRCSNRQIWIASRFEGIGLLDPVSMELNHYRNIPGDNQSLSVNHVNCLIKDHSGIVWIGTAQGGLNTIDTYGKRFITIQASEEDKGSYTKNRINGIIQDDEGRIWIGTYRNGMLASQRGIKDIYSRDVEFQRIHPEKITGNNVNYMALFRDSRNWLWIGTSQGLQIYDLTGNKMLDIYLPAGYGPTLPE